MCGISGVFDPSGRLSRERLIDAATVLAEAQAHRGPDDQGVWLSPDGRCALSHRRLSILDVSSAGHQPMISADGRYGLTYNGELYNFPEIAEAMTREGARFQTRSDTEVLLAGLIRDGEAFVSRMDAMFAFGFYDSEAGRLILARDRFGEKPLYFTRQDGIVAFASEMSALARLPWFDPVIDADDIAAYLSFQYVPAPRALYRNCAKLEPGCLMRIEADGSGSPRRYYDLRFDGPREGAADLDALADELEELLVVSLRRRLISDVPLGAFLSGGVDSTTTVALAMRRLNRSIEAFSMGFADSPDSEHEDARAIARHLGADLKDQLVRPEELLNVEAIARMLDEPNADSSCLPTHLLSKFTRASVTVAVTGDGGDEMFGGYGRYGDCMAAVAAHQDRIADGTWHAGRDYFSGRLLIFDDRDLRLLLGEDPDPVPPLVKRLRAGIDADDRPLIHTLRETDVRHYMPGAVLAKLDRMSMSVGLETRTPFLSEEIGRFAASLPPDALWRDGLGKPVLRRLASRHLPAEWMARPKRGFGMPVSGWGERTLAPMLRAILAEPDNHIGRWMPSDRIAAYLARPGAASFYQLWSLAILELWLRRHPSRPGAPLGAANDERRAVDAVA